MPLSVSSAFRLAFTRRNIRDRRIRDSAELLAVLLVAFLASWTVGRLHGRPVVDQSFNIKTGLSRGLNPDYNVDTNALLWFCEQFYYGE